MKLKLIITLLLITSSAASAGTDSLRTEIAKFLGSKQARIGMACRLIETGDTLSYGNEHHYPMQSVFKFHLALALLDQVQQGALSLDKSCHLTQKDLLPETWSPMRDKYPSRKADLKLGELINYMVSQSDNNACDYLFQLYGGPAKVNNFIHSIGISDLAIISNERDMHKKHDLQYKNWTTPTAAVDLLTHFFGKKIIQGAEYEFLMKAMIETTTGPDRIKGRLPAGTIVAHKTGSSGQNSKGLSAATNDIGIITLPNGHHLALSVFVCDSWESESDNAAIIADLSKMLWEYYKDK